MCDYVAINRELTHEKIMRLIAIKYFNRLTALIYCIYIYIYELNTVRDI